MTERKPPYEDANAVEKLYERASNEGGAISNRLNKVFDMASKGGDTCFALTLAFTHPSYADQYDVSKPVPNLGAYHLATELTELSGEELSRNYFGKVDNSEFRNFEKEDLEQYLEGANAVWFCTIDKQKDKSGEEGYNHALGIIPNANKDMYIVFDASGYIDPLIPFDIDGLYDALKQLPVGEQYMQSIFSFREPTPTLGFALNKEQHKSTSLFFSKTEY